MTIDKSATSTVEQAGPAARGERRRAKTRAAIIAAAEELLGHTAPDSVRIEDVATRAGVSPATVYVHFGSKDGLVAATTEHLLEVATAEVASVTSGDGPAVERIIATGRAYLQLLIDHPALTRYLTGRQLRTDAIVSASDLRIDEQLEGSRLAFEQLIQDAIDAGEVLPHDARLMSHFLFGAWVGLAALSLEGNPRPLTDEDVSRAGLQALEVLTRGAAARP
ncbi:TetR/AcrR family transcriptional regulator [Tsukamurella sp. 1534]|uniref:TetR/AcrR family transcriptional regulator n=1 Tax=Tsukamurella sp. 1534 TaxID=1151061 RepID=UPI0006ACA8AC|nr:TetR/AcrR family transcriptional regulator [Tsukamurella sp. 1534]